MLVSVLTHDSFSSEFDKWYKLFFIALSYLFSWNGLTMEVLLNLYFQ